ncbi:uncharacterized protein [Primulina eburnea]|uniref:uncharacterized protein n=1 Tax=Primulina eburnea TaxID=1245227 RepID=UPI003C6C5114
MAPKPDIGWEFGQIVGDNRKIIICKFCGKPINGGIMRFKEHIALVSANVQACYKAPKKISLMIRKHLQDSMTKRNILKKKKELGLESIQQSVHGLESESSGEDASEDIETQQLRKVLKESRNTRAFEEEMRNRYGQGFIGSSSSSGLNPGLKREMQSKLSSKGIDSFMFPSKHKSIKNWFGVEKVKGVGKAIQNVIDEIGEENVVQVVTDSECAMKAAGEKLMMERPHLFWSPCAAHCLDLILEDVDLKRMCNSTEWEEINNTGRRRKEAAKITGIIIETRFWKRARDICAAMGPLVKVLKLVDQDKKPTMSIIYEAMDRAKLTIKENTKV